PHDNTEAAIAGLEAALVTGPRTIDAARARWTDDGVRHERWFAGALTGGFDAIVNERANNMRHPKGPSRYILAILAELTRLRPLDYRLGLDGREDRTAANLVAVANNVSFGGGRKITPDALDDAGLLDVFIVEPLSRTAFLRLFPKVFSGDHVGHPKVRIERAKKVRIEADGIVAYGDGERFGALPMEVEVVPGALRVLSKR